MNIAKLPSGTAHILPEDFEQVLLANVNAAKNWQTLTPLARNEWICWVVSVKRDKTRQEHINRAIEEIADGMRRPCCWLGCIHRTDKELSPSQRYLTKS